MPFGLTALDGALYATDGNQEHVTRISPDGQAQRILQYPASDHVLTGISPGPDHALYVAEFGPSPHLADSARITRLTTDGEIGVAVAGLENAIDVDFDGDGQLYVLEFGRPGVRIPQSGRVLRLRSDGVREIVASGLNFPTAMAFGPDANLYVTNNGHRGAGPDGEIVRVQLAPRTATLGAADVSVRLIGAVLLSAVVGGGIFLLGRR